MWNYEEFWHGDAIGRVLAAHDETAGPSRIGALRQKLPKSDKWRPVGFQIASALTPHLTAVHMTWGAVNEWTTQAAYARLNKLADHPTLSLLLRRIMKQEGRHIDFYASQASGRLATSRAAQRLTRWALHRFWSPVGTGVVPEVEVDFLRTYLFGDPEGLTMAERIDRRVDRLPGLDGLHLLARHRSRPEIVSKSGTVGRQSTAPPAHFPGPRPRNHIVRTQANRLLVVFALLVFLPTIVVAERIHRGSGRRVARWAVSVGAVLCGVRVVVHGNSISDHSDGSVVVPNHSSPMDIPVLLLADPDVRFMAAEDLFCIPLLASAMRALGTVPIDRRDSANAHRQLDLLVADRRNAPVHDLVVFPEGGIAPPGRRRPFKSGAFSLAIRTGSAIVPVVITGTDHVLRPRGRLAVRPGVVTVEFLDAIETQGLTLDDRHVLRDHVQELVTNAMTMPTEGGMVPPSA